MMLALPAFSGAAAAQGKEKGIEPIDRIDRMARLALFDAQTLAGRDDFDGAAGLLLDFVGKHGDRDHFWVRFHLANNLLMAERIEEAFDHYRAATDMEPRFEQGWLNLGEVAYRLGRYDVAAGAIYNGYRLNGEKQPRLYYYSAISFFMAKDHSRSAEMLEELVSGSHGEPEMEWYRALIQAAIALDDGDRGKRAVDGMLHAFSGDPDAWLLAFQVAAANSDYRQAAIALTVVGYLRPLSGEEQLQLGDIYSAIGVPAEASMHYESAIAAGKGASQEYERLASAYLASYEMDKALETIGRALELHPTVRLWSLLGDLQYMERNYEAAFEAFGGCLELDPGQGRAHLMRGYCQLELGNPPEALVHLLRAAEFPGQADRANALIARTRERMN